MTAVAHTAPLYVVRPPRPDESMLIVNSWIGTLRRDIKRRRQDVSRVRPDVFYDAERRRIPRLLTTFGALVATLPEVPDEVLGWACLGPGVLHYAFTKEHFRGAGVCRSILTEAGLLPGSFDVSVLTHDVIGWMQAGRGVTFNPYAGA